jgi:hypothetical protein
MSTLLRLCFGFRGFNGLGLGYSIFIEAAFPSDAEFRGKKNHYATVDTLKPIAATKLTFGRLQYV